LIILCLIGLTYGQQESGIVKGWQCAFSTRIEDAITSNEKDCFRLCKITPGVIAILDYF